MLNRDENITPNFKWGEFIRPVDPTPAGPVLDNIAELAKRLQGIRDMLRLPISINSGYRTPSHNKAVGGARNSYHLKGMAADIVIKGMKARDFQELMEDWDGGMGEYYSFTHLDIGPKRRWL